MTEPHANADAASASPDRATDDAIRYRTDQVLGIVDAQEHVESAVTALQRARFLDSEVSVFCGQAAAEALDASTGRTGLAHLAIRVAERLGLSNDEMAMKERYEQALRDGRFVVAVFAPSDERTELAAQTLRVHGGHFIHHLRRFSIERIHPERA
ncbi:MAG TPA: hypothetical protein VFW98_12750 [Gemmatimonadaceae bacterium]|nr:hypothetical protein [Gemmatimonadaceae bacterium]